MITIDKTKSTEIELGSIACYFLIIFYIASLNTLFFCGNLSSEIIIMSSSFFMCLSGVSITIFHDNEQVHCKSRKTLEERSHARGLYSSQNNFRIIELQECQLSLKDSFLQLDVTPEPPRALLYNVFYILPIIFFSVLHYQNVAYLKQARINSCFVPIKWQENV